MTFSESIKTCLEKKYCDLNGRASISEYWWWVLFTFIIGVAFGILENVFGSFFGWLNWAVSLALLLPSIGVGVRRLHDTGRSGWFLLLGLIPLVGAIILIIWFLQPSQQQANEYGEKPLS